MLSHQSVQRPSSLSSAGDGSVCDRFHTGRGVLQMSIPSKPLLTEGQPLYPQYQGSGVVNLRVFHLVLWCHRSSESCCVHCGVAAACRRQLVPHLAIIKPSTLVERCLVVRTGKSFFNFPHAMRHLPAMALSQPPPVPKAGWLPPALGSLPNLIYLEYLRRNLTSS